MINVTAKPRGESDGSITRQFTDSVDTTLVTYVYETSQDNLTIKNKGYVPLIINIGGSDITIQPKEESINDVTFISFTIKTSIGVGEFVATAKEYDNRLVTNSQLADIAHKQWNDFMYTIYSPWLGIAVLSGVINGEIGNSKHPGVISYSSTTTANSGCSIRSYAQALSLIGGEKTTIIFKTATTLTGVTRRMGFHSSVDSTAPQHGVYAKIQDGILTGQTATNGTISTTSTNYTLTSDTWYRAVIELNANATKATYTLYQDDSNVILWSDTLTTNIPLTYKLGHSDVCTYNSASSVYIGYIDYLDVILPNARRIV